MSSAIFVGFFSKNDAGSVPGFWIFSRIGVNTMKLGFGISLISEIESDSPDLGCFLTID